MVVYRKHVIVQLVLFVAFALMGVDIFLGHFVFAGNDAYPIVVLVVLLFFFGGGLYLYKKKDDRTVVITAIEMKIVKIVLYTAIGIYLLEMILSGSIEKGKDLVIMTAAILLTLTALFGVIIQTRILKPAHHR